MVAVAGVMYVCVHSASQLLGLDRNGLSDPYCIIYSNGKKVMVTVLLSLHNLSLHYISLITFGIQTSSNYKCHFCATFHLSESIALHVTALYIESVWFVTTREVAVYSAVIFLKLVSILSRKNDHIQFVSVLLKMKTTHYVARTKNPSWDVSTEFIVGDYTHTMLSFTVYDWDGRSVSDDDFLGSAHLLLAKVRYNL